KFGASVLWWAWEANFVVDPRLPFQHVSISAFQLFPPVRPPFSDLRPPISAFQHVSFSVFSPAPPSTPSLSTFTFSAVVTTISCTTCCVVLMAKIVAKNVGHYRYNLGYIRYNLGYIQRVPFTPPPATRHPSRVTRYPHGPKLGSLPDGFGSLSASC